jgi:hypothetical protein
MIKINFPSHPFRTKKEDKEFIFDGAQTLGQIESGGMGASNFLQYLIGEKKYPSSWVAVEREMVNYRSDLIYSCLTIVQALHDG